MDNGQNSPSSSLLTTSSWRRLLNWTLCNFALNLMKTYARQLLMELVVSLTFWTRAMFVTCSRLDDPPGCQAGWALLRPPGRPLPSPGYDMCTACNPDNHCKHWCFEDFNLNTLSITSYGSYIYPCWLYQTAQSPLRDNNHLMTSARLVQKVWNVVSEI